MFEVREISLRRQWYEYFLAHYASHENLARIAYGYWEEEGRPDGEQPLRPGYAIKVREAHWLRAQLIAEVLADTDSLTMVFATDKTPKECEDAYIRSQTSSPCHRRQCIDLTTADGCG